MIYGTHNHDMCHKLVGHPITCRLMPREKKIIYDSTLNMMQSKNIFATLKVKDLEISQISREYIMFVTKTTRR